MIRRVMQKGIKKGEILPNIEPEQVATMTIAIFEGGLIMTQLHDDSIYLKRAINHLNQYVESLGNTQKVQIPN